MSLRKILTSMAVIGMFGIALAQEEHRVRIEVIADDDSGDASHVRIDSEDLGFSLHDMQVGENQAIVDDEGRTILVTREADGFRFDVDGKTVSVPMLHGEHDDMMIVHGDHGEEVDVEVESVAEGVHKVRVVKKVEVAAE